MTHQPNTPRTHNAAMERVHEPVQCADCLQAWPCEVEQLQQRLQRAHEVLTVERTRISNALDELGELGPDVPVAVASARAILRGDPGSSPRLVEQFVSPSA